MNEEAERHFMYTPSPSYPFILEFNDGVLIKCHVQPNAKQQKITIDPSRQFLKIKVNAPPVEGLANQRLIETITNWLNIKPGQVVIVKGGRSRYKELLIKEVSIQRIVEKLNLISTNIK